MFYSTNCFINQHTIRANQKQRSKPMAKKNLNAATTWKLDWIATGFLIALLAAIAVTVFSFNQAEAKPGEIKAKSEMTKAEIKALNISKAPLEARNALR